MNKNIKSARFNIDAVADKIFDKKLLLKDLRDFFTFEKKNMKESEEDLRKASIESLKDFPIVSHQHISSDINQLPKPFINAMSN